MRNRRHGDHVTVEPLANLPVLTDLVVDMGGFFDRFPDGRSPTRASEVLPESEPPAGHDHYLRLEDCIECGPCLSACPVAATAHDYVGPAALTAARRRLEQTDDPAEREDLLAWVSRPEGVWSCHIGLECTTVCPVDALPGERIMALRRELLTGNDGQ
ncbi:MAG: 4Fe-4S dicluster domain-containing protein [Solirubrobacteraceae bacterium]